MVQPKYLLFIIISFVFFLSACTNDQTTSNKTEGDTAAKGNTVQGEKVLNIAIPADPKTLDPQFSAALSQIAIAENAFSGLVRFPPGTVDVSKIEGDLAEKWESNEEATQWTFHLRQGVQWHKGYGEVTAEDIKASFERVKNPDNGVPNASQYSHVESIETPDQYTVVFNLNRQDPIFVTKLLAYSSGFIVNTKALEKGEYVGTGPFAIEEHKTQDSVVLVKHKEFFRGEPKIDKILYKVMSDPTAVDAAVDKGEIHIMHGTSDPLWQEGRKKNPNIYAEFSAPLAISGYYLNMSEPPFDDIKVRQAVAHAIDTKAYSDSMLITEGGGEAKGPVPSDVPGSVNVGAYKYDPEKAKQLLKEAGYENGLTLPNHYISSVGYVQKAMLYAQDQLKAVGIELPLEQIDDTTYVQNMRKGMNLLTYQAFTRIPHLIYWLHDVYYGPSTVGTPTGVINFSHYNKSDDLIEQMLIETDEEKAKQIGGQVIQQIQDEYVAIILAEYSVPEIRSKNVDLGYNNDKHEGNLLYYPIITEATDIKQ